MAVTVGGNNPTPTQKQQFRDAFDLGSVDNTSDANKPISTAAQAALNDKVDKVAGKALSSNDYTDIEKAKLAGIADNATNYTHPASHPPSIITQDASNRFVTDAEKTAWNAKAAGTHSHAIADLPVAASGTSSSTQLVRADDARLSDAREWSAETISQTEVEAGTATARRAWTSQRVRQAIAAWWTGIVGTVVQQSDIGTAPNEIPLNQHLGDLAFQNANSLVIRPAASASPQQVGSMVFQLTNDTTLVIKVKGSDGTIRSATLTLA